MQLHTVNKSPSQSALLEDCLDFIPPDAALLLIEDGVLAAVDNEMNRELFDGIQNPLYVLAADVTARGLQGRLLDRFMLVDYAGFVGLCTQARNVVNWN